MADFNKNLTAEKISKLQELVTVRRISDLADAPEIIDGADSAVLNNSYILTSTYLTSLNRYTNYKLKLNSLTDYLNGVGKAEIEAFKINFNDFITSLVNNTDNSFIKFVKSSQIGDDETNYSYTIATEYSVIQDNTQNPFDSSYQDYFSYSLSSGIVTSDILERYVRETIGTILGVPSSPAAVSTAIDSVIEFVEWFRGYNKDQDGLETLITKINNKDTEIINSYQGADTELQNQINNLNTAINNIEVPVEGVASSYNQLTIGGKVYTLTLDNKKLKFVEYTPISITETSGGGDFEIDSTASQSNRTFKVTANKNISTATWKNDDDSSATETATTSGSISQITVTQSNNTKITRKCAVSDGSSSDISGNITLTFTKKRYFLGWSTDANLTFNDSNSGTNITSTANYNSFTSKLSTTEIYGSGFATNNSGGYWYMIWPTTVSIGNIYFGTGTAKAAAPGGWQEHFVTTNANDEIVGWQEGDAVKASDNGQTQTIVKQYSTQQKYYVYRSDYPFSGQMNIRF